MKKQKLLIKIINTTEKEGYDTWFNHEYGNILEVIDKNKLYYQSLDKELIKKYSWMKDYYRTNGLMVAKVYCQIVGIIPDFVKELDRILDI